MNSIITGKQQKAKEEKAQTVQQAKNQKAKVKTLQKKLTAFNNLRKKKVTSRTSSNIAAKARQFSNNNMAALQSRIGKKKNGITQELYNSLVRTRKNNAARQQREKMESDSSSRMKNIAEQKRTNYKKQLANEEAALLRDLETLPNNLSRPNFSEPAMMF